MEQAQAWVNTAKENNLYARWVQAKLFLRTGNVKESIKILQKLKNAFPKKESWGRDPPFVRIPLGARSPLLGDYEVCPYKDVRGELAILLLRRNAYVEAMDLFLQGGFWLDAAYIAEQVLTLAELENHVHNDYPEWLVKQVNELEEWEEMRNISFDEKIQTRGEKLHYLLAKRLLREERWDKALNYINYVPEKIKDIMQTYISYIKAGRNPALSDHQRAKYLYMAAQVIRSNGFELLGTEVAPDWAAVPNWAADTWDEYGPSPDLEVMPKDLEKHRLNKNANSYSLVPQQYHTLILASNDEKWRATRHQVQPNDNRFYYLYADKLSREASKLLPK